MKQIKVIEMAFFDTYRERAETELMSEVRMAKELGIYPYFKELCSEQGPIVEICGREGFYNSGRYFAYDYFG